MSLPVSCLRAAEVGERSSLQLCNWSGSQKKQIGACLSHELCAFSLDTKLLEVVNVRSLYLREHEESALLGASTGILEPHLGREVLIFGRKMLDLETGGVEPWDGRCWIWDASGPLLGRIRAWVWPRNELSKFVCQRLACL